MSETDEARGPGDSVLERAISACHDALEREAEELTTHFERGALGALDQVIARHRAALEALAAIRDGRERAETETPPVGGGEPARPDAPADHDHEAPADRDHEAPADRDHEAPADRDHEAGAGGQPADGSEGAPPKDVEGEADDEQPRRPDPEVVDALLEYRRAAMAEVLEPLLEACSTGPAKTLAESLERTLDVGLAACEALPESIEAPWPDDALLPRPSDGRLRRARKPLARLLSAARKAGTPRDVPLRAVAVRHFLQVTVPGEERGRVEAMTAWAEWVRQLEVALIAWVQEVLDLVVALEDPSYVPEGDAWSTVLDAGAELQGRLQALAADPPAQHGVEATQARLEAANSVLEGDLAVAGSFLYSPSLPKERRVRTPEVTRAAARFTALDEGFTQRLRMYVAVLSLLTGMLGVRERLLARFRMSCLPGTDRLLELADEFEALAAEIERSTEAADVVNRIRPRVEAALEEADGLVLSAAEIEAILAPRAVSAVEAMFAILRQAPETLVINSAEARARAGVLKVERRIVPLQEFARQSFDALRMERIRSAASGLGHVGVTLRHQVDALPQVLTYAYEQAEEELDRGEDGAAARARTFVAVAVRNIGESLRSALEDVDVAMDEVEAVLASESRSGASILLDRIQAGVMQAQLLRARSGVAALRAWVNENWGPPLDRALRVGRVWWTKFVRVASRGLRRGSQMVAGHAAGEAGSARELKVLADPKSVTERLPLVYQRLFTFEPVSDPALLAGRARELEDAMNRWGRWMREDAVPLIVKGRQGTGISSFLNVLSGQIAERGEEVLRIELSERVTDEKMLARMLARRLDLPPCGDLDDVASAVFSTKETPGVVAIDNLEHLYLRVPGGTDLTERLLTLMSETEPRIFWIGGIASSAWQLVATAEPTAVSQVEALDLAPLAPEALRDAITVRHRRSGLPVRYEEPTEGRALLRRKLRRARTAEARRELLVTDFFEQLQRTSGGNLRLALFLALQASDLRSGDGLLLRTPERPDFAVLETLTLTQNFTLKAFLEHRTLTLTEHDRIFRLPRHESYQIFESLANRHLIRVLHRTTDAENERSEVEEERRYALQPLLVGAVISHLAGRNIVH